MAVKTRTITLSLCKHKLFLFSPKNYKLICIDGGKFASLLFKQKLILIKNIFKNYQNV